MPKLKVLFLARADFAGSGYFATQAINSVGRVQCRQLIFYPHIYEYPYDILIPRCFIPKPIPSTPELDAEAERVLEEADFIHIWNDEIPNFRGVIDFDVSKVRSYTFSGSYYRERPGHTAVNARLKELGASIVVQNPTYFWPEETEGLHVEYIPHAIDLSRFDHTQPKEHKTIGCYKPAHGNTSAPEDVTMLDDLLGEKFKGWNLCCTERTIWTKRLQCVAKCSLYFEYMCSKLGYFGRSALEACAFGIPTMSYLSAKAYEFGGKRLGIPPIIHVTPETLEKRLKELTSSVACRAKIGLMSRQWVEIHFSYPVVGELYTRFFENLKGEK